MLRDRVALVTGAGSGIGRGIALSLAEGGASVVAVGRTYDKVKSTADLIARIGGSCLPLPMDVSHADEIENVLEQCTARFGRVDILVNNAGVHVTGGIRKVSEQQWDWIMSINLKGAFLCSKLAAPAMLQRKWGRIINIASVRAITPSLNAAYSVSKGAVVTLTKAMALELSPGGITVNAICPGTIVTDMNSESLSDPHVRAAELAKTPVGRFGEPSDIGAAVVYLSSDAARFVTGSVLVIDGGCTCT